VEWYGRMHGKERGRVWHVFACGGGAVRPGSQTVASVSCAAGNQDACMTQMISRLLCCLCTLACPLASQLN
jgi:hypothetical protein